ncbi:polyketide cyclase [Microbacterium sp. CH12i]|uniref:SRPBCC family protein n=1 Tax=Microbacterium sp. CH12i TaxID=1479651 RepID=UPI000460F683|nr:SRPBCC family protein [Microbacterium sp. CH12i]KDA06564.1 polyketide cyclase [Microbacterium sp. CH12i]
MPVVTAKVFVPVDVATAFAVSQTTGAIRRRWDPFISEQHYLDDAPVAAKGVRVYTRQRLGFTMISHYVSFAPPLRAGMVMERGPWFFEKLGGGWRYTPAEDGSGTYAVWKYNFTCRPAWLAPIAEWVGVRVLGYEIRGRIKGFAKGCEDPKVLASVNA